jgi:hypothetical protein
MAHAVGVMLGVSHRTACGLIDSGEIPGRRNPIGRRERLVSHETIANLSKAGGKYGGILAKISNLPPG